ncbi:hypothetical protein F383_33184 [Gossypium arboreum]|uniref:Uncharacterized protein n=1 Tax=Gossypium arboreum TaxID=29729 RepID=A0A0B0N547_GOSAR|nr:hypothetical protein F383_33184 [Gossypium arboreum]
MVLHVITYRCQRPKCGLIQENILKILCSYEAFGRRNSIESNSYT